MTRLPAKALIFAQTISGERNPSPTLFEALNEYRSSLDNKHEANNRVKVLQRHLQKTKSQAKNHKNQRLEHDYIQKMAELDREILQMNSFAQQKAVKRQKEDNMRSKNRAKMHQRQAKNQLQETNSWLYKSSQRKSLQNQRTILMQTERDQAEKEIWAMKERIREKRRSSKIADYYLKKIQEVRNQKQREISILKIERKKRTGSEPYGTLRFSALRNPTPLSTTTPDPFTTIPLSHFTFGPLGPQMANPFCQPFSSLIKLVFYNGPIFVQTIYDIQFEMSQRQFPNRRQEEHLRQLPYSEKSAASSKESHASRKEADKLTTMLHDLVIKRDWAKKQADQQWEDAKKYEAQGRMNMALEAKTRCEKEAHRVKCYNLEIDEIEKMIDKLTLVYSVGLQKGENYAKMKVEGPPSNNEE